jgi:hypothetical protein
MRIRFLTIIHLSHSLHLKIRTHNRYNYFARFIMVSIDSPFSMQAPFEDNLIIKH